MKIAIVDDSSLDRDFLKNGLEIIFEERNIENLEIQEFSSGEELLNYLILHIFSTLFLWTFIWKI